MQKIMTIDEAAAWAREFRASGKKLAVTNGVFDLLHRGHVEYLMQAAAQADGLLVALNSDAAVHQLKGPERPIVPQEDRAWMMASLECVSAVVIFDNVRATEVFEKIPLDLYVKGGDYTEDSLDREEYAALKRQGAKFAFLPLVPGRSTTSIVRQIRGEAKADFSGARKIGPILARRSVRKYQLRPVSDELLEETLQAAMAAPSACRQDPWHFVVVRKPEILKQLATVMPNGPFLADCSAAILVCGSPTQAHAAELSFMLQDCSAAMENLLLAASMNGLGACWLAVHPHQERMAALAKILPIPEGFIPFAMATIGWPAEFPPAGSRYQASKCSWL